MTAKMVDVSRTAIENGSISILMENKFINVLLHN